MKKLTLQKNQKGFSLIELMIVVAIIGTLASIAIPNYRQYINNTRDSQAKSILSGFYTANQIFHGEWLTYFGDWRNLGFQVDGDLYYRIGFNAGCPGFPPAPNGYVGPGIQSGNTAVICQSAQYCSLNPAQCYEIPDQWNFLNGALHRWSNDSFVAAASGFQQTPRGTVVPVIWSIDQNKKLRNTAVP